VSVRRSPETELSNDSRRKTVFFTCVGSAPQAERAGLLLDSIRAFGGRLADCAFWALSEDEDPSFCSALEDAGAEVVPFRTSESLGGYLFARKVSACARAEELAGESVGTLVWLIPECLVLQPPLLFALDGGVGAAVRPVHITNVGSPADQPPDPFWSGIYETVGRPPESFSVESFIEGERIRPYFNSAAFSIDPSLGLMGEWLRLFGAMVADDGFQTAACADELHRIFLHQAILSALVATSVERARVRVLPPEYGYPYNLHGSVPPDRRAEFLVDTVCPIYEERSVDPRVVDDIGIDEPLRSWLMGRTEGGGRE
jgi:hypothetical protein